MAKVLRCSDTGVACTWDRYAETKDGLLQTAAKHAAEVHNETSFPREENERFRTFLRDE